MMPAGTYVICDLCYVMHGEWKEVCDLIIQKDENGNFTVLEGEFNLADGRRFAIYSTAYGDGEYQTNVGGSLGVDSGSIGCIRLEDIDQTDPSNMIKLGNIVKFDTEFKTSGYTESRRDWDGVIKIGHVEVYTGCEEEYEEEPEYDFPDEDDDGYDNY